MNLSMFFLNSILFWLIYLKDLNYFTTLSKPNFIIVIITIVVIIIIASYSEIEKEPYSFKFIREDFVATRQEFNYYLQQINFPLIDLISNLEL